MGPLLAHVPGAEIVVRTSTWEIVGTGRADASGEFAFPDLPCRELYACVTAEGMGRHVEVCWPSSGSERLAPRRIRLWSGATVRGVVRDAEGRPVANAEVVAANDAAWVFRTGDERADSVWTGKDGAFVLEHVPLGEVCVRASAEGYLMAEVPVWLRGDARVDVALDRGEGRTLEVRVVGVPEARLQDVAITWRPQHPLAGFVTFPTRLVEGNVDGEGVWRAAGLPEGYSLFHVRVRDCGLEFAEPPCTVESGDGEITFTKPVVIGPRPPADHGILGEPLGPEEGWLVPPSGPAPLPSELAEPTLRGRVVDAHGGPIGGEVLRVFSDPTGWVEATTDAEGVFAFDIPGCGSLLAFELWSEEIALIDEIVHARAGRTVVYHQFERGREYRLRAEHTASLRGRVVTHEGESVAGTSVYLEMSNDGLVGEIAASAVTDLRGGFEITRIRPGRSVVVSVWREGGEVFSEPLMIDDARVIERFELRLPAPTKIEGVVVDARGDPVPGIRLQAFGATKRRWVSSSAGEAFSDARGRFVLQVSNPDAYELRVERSGERALAAPIQFEADGSGRSIALEVRLAHDAPLDG